ncbi:MAG: methyl-accepting chemotaxis protein [Candidatus Omnitrophica bacterium]|nr:methyl-accepting chemotaxis protein [Candidatus Omnitrophota bacterium]
MKIKNRRKNYFIKKQFQTEFFIKFIALLLSEGLLLTSLFMLMARGTLVTAYGSDGLVIKTAGGYFFLNFIIATLLVGTAIGIAGVFVFIYLTHRLGGPLYKIEKTIGEAAEGDISKRIELRSTDQLGDLKDGLNFFLDSVDGYISEIKKDLSGIITCCSDSDGMDPEKVRELGARLEKMRASLTFFNTSKYNENKP